MGSSEEDELLTRVGPGTPMGQLLRRYWQPAALSEELPPGGAPLPVRLMGEDLVLFRDPSTGSGQAGRPGLLGLHCAHRGADLSYGRLEDGGLRCIYHGWLYDAEGHCLEQPGEPPGSAFHTRIRHTAYLRDLDDGRDPLHVIRNSNANSFPGLVVVSEVIPASMDWRSFWRNATAGVAV